MDHMFDVSAAKVAIQDLLNDAVCQSIDEKICVAIGAPDDRHNFSGKDFLRNLNENPSVLNGNLFCSVSTFDGMGVKAENAVSTRGIFIDVDCGSVGHKGNTRFTSPDEAFKYLLKQPLPPSMVWNTGHGIQAVYLLKNTVYYSDPAQSEKLRRAKAIICSATFSDKVTSPAQLFRLPGTINDKSAAFPGVLPVRGTVLQPLNSSCRYELDDIISKFQSLIPTAALTKELPLDQLLSVNHEAGTRSEMFFLAVKALKKAGRNKEEICNAVEANQSFRDKYGTRIADEVWRCLEKLDVPTPNGWMEGIISKDSSLKVIVEKQGNPFFAGSRDGICVNQMFFAMKFTRDHKIMFSSSEGIFYVYDDASGQWSQRTETTLKMLFSDDLRSFYEGHPSRDKIDSLRNDGMLRSLVSLLKGFAEKGNPFERLSGSLNMLHLKNGMLVIEPSGGIGLKPFDSEFMSRNKIPFNYNPEATCPRFLNELLVPYLSGDDIELIQKYFGCILLGGNPIQCFLILSGTPGGGKGTLCEIIELVIGQDNVAELRTNHLSERFEIAAYVGKLLLAGKDVPGDFLQNRSASVIKKLVGHDHINGEMKGANTRAKMRGDFPMVINCNSRLNVRLDGDVDAWRRRTLIVEYNRPAVKKPVPNFASQLVIQEGDGILAWGIKGALKLMEDIEKHGKIQLSPAQIARVDALLLESDSIRVFVKEYLGKGPGDVTSAELITNYVEFCNDKGWNALASRTAENQLPDIILNEFGVHRSNDIKRNAKSQRGYHGVIFKQRGGKNTI